MKVKLSAQAKRGSRRWRKISSWSLAAVAVVLIGLAVALKILTYEQLEQAEAAMTSDNKVTVSKVSNGYRFELADTEALEPNVIFYPGGLVEPESYCQEAGGVGTSRLHSIHAS